MADNFTLITLLCIIIITKEDNTVESKPIKSANLEPESIPSLKKEIARLTEDNKKLKAKIKKQEITILTVRDRAAQAVHRFTVLQGKYDKLKEEKTKPMITLNIGGHNVPPKV